MINYIKKMKNKKILYLLLLLVIVLVGLIVSPTYAKFASNFTTEENVVGMNLNFDIGISNIEEYETIRVSAGETIQFDVKITNGSSSEDTLYYGVWYRNNNSVNNDDVKIARYGLNDTPTTGELAFDTTKTVGVVIENKSNRDINVDIGVSSSDIGISDIEYLNGKKLIKAVFEMMNIYFSDYNDERYYRNDLYRHNIISASFVDYIDTSNATSSDVVWDVSNDGSIIVWIENSETEGYYDLYFGSKNTIYAEDLSYLFEGLINLQSVSFDNLDTIFTKNMKSMFSGCESLVSLDVSSFDTSNVTDMSWMFQLTSLQNLDVSNFNTSNVTKMAGMFGECSDLTGLDLSSFDTSNVTNMEYMFGDCSALTILNLSSFDTSNVTNMEYMFAYCWNLTTEIVISNVNVADYADMFLGAATSAGAQIVVYYTDETSNLVDSMIATKSEGSNVIKGGNKSYLVNSPNLDNGNLIPVYYDDSEGVESWRVADSNNTNNSWYDYENKMWANAVIIDPDATADYTVVNTLVDEADVIAYYVWIPRFKYRVWNITRQGGVESTYAYSAFTNGIEIQFENGTVSTGNVECTYDVTTTRAAANLSDACIYNNADTITTTSGNTSYTDAWYTHPAFNFGDEEIEGFWIGKFETSAASGDNSNNASVTCYSSPTNTNCNNSSIIPRILPDVQALRYQQISNQFVTAAKFQNYLSNDVSAHMAKNLEWGAVTYLTHSKYGLCSKNDCRGAYINNSSSYFTGRSGGAISGSADLALNTVYSGSTTSTNKYNVNGYYNYKGYFIDYDGNVTTTKDITKVASTTRNITGVYDMSGGSLEYVMGDMVNGNKVFWASNSGTSWSTTVTGTGAYDGYDSTIWYDSTNSILYSKYYNSYAFGTSVGDVKAYNAARLGDATAEVLGAATGDGWNPGSSISGQSAGMVYSSAVSWSSASYQHPWFVRSGDYDDSNAGLFYFNKNNGSEDVARSFRAVIS